MPHDLRPRKRPAQSPPSPRERKPKRRSGQATPKAGRPRVQAAKPLPERDEGLRPAANGAAQRADNAAGISAKAFPKGNVRVVIPPRPKTDGAKKKPATIFGGGEELLEISVTTMQEERDAMVEEKAPDVAKEPERASLPPELWLMVMSHLSDQDLWFSFRGTSKEYTAEVEKKMIRRCFEGKEIPLFVDMKRLLQDAVHKDQKNYSDMTGGSPKGVFRFEKIQEGGICAEFSMTFFKSPHFEDESAKVRRSWVINYELFYFCLRQAFPDICMGMHIYQYWNIHKSAKFRPPYDEPKTLRQLQGEGCYDEGKSWRSWYHEQRGNMWSPWYTPDKIRWLPDAGSSSSIPLVSILEVPCEIEHQWRVSVNWRSLIRLGISRDRAPILHEIHLLKSGEEVDFQTFPPYWLPRGGLKFEITRLPSVNLESTDNVISDREWAKLNAPDKIAAQKFLISLDCAKLKKPKPPVLTGTGTQ